MQNQSYKSHTGYCTVFSLQRDVLDLRIGISRSYRFDSKNKKIKVQEFETLFKLTYTGRYLIKNTSTPRYLVVQTSTGRYFTGTISDINECAFFFRQYVWYLYLCAKLQQ